MAGPSYAEESLRTLRVVGTEFQIETSSGRTLKSRELVGATLTVQQGEAVLHIRIDDVFPDPKDGAQDIWLHQLSVEDPSTGAWRPLCEPDPDGKRLAFPLAGVMEDSTGTRKRTPDTVFTLTCTSGAEGKCVRFGYKPWKKTAQGIDLWDHHQACTRLVRADYCGDGQGTTRNGTWIDIYDTIGIQKSEPKKGMRFEAAWGPRGALCVNHPRIPENISLEALRRCPQLAKAPLGESCREKSLSSNKEALLFNKSF
ncbi:ADYC domain-containing protein [Stigmatella sp. ncwal1]|uniref:ADYC domain-containing protein n=1 Tax=Stigmatella ashevillensis TaxID=2995309 RepID=A0ABT5DD61_9BACT|nr:ADYC domain-containing protein [Stigmatella ashevillena]MDC0711563.1 ADYC domain-containing protein [Stigmatella ashevillena]